MRIILTFMLALIIAASSISNAAGEKRKGGRKTSDTEAPVIFVPANITAEATGPAGTVISFNVTATDNARKSPIIVCSPSSGSTFGITQSTVYCTAKDRYGNSTTGSFLVNVVDTVKPVLSLPAKITSNTTSSSSDFVSFNANATDNIDGAITAMCSPASGAQFPVGETSVSCYANDSHGNEATGSFIVSLVQTLVDTIAPVLSLPADITSEASSANGAVVTYSVSTVDDTDTVVEVSCSNGSGSTFPISSTVVRCTANDSQGNTSTGSFTISVVDSTKPVLSVPSDIAVEAIDSTGVAVTYAVGVQDSVDQTVAASCRPLSGSVFTVGEHPVNCDATDSSGNSASASFLVSVSLAEIVTETVAGNASVNLSWSLPTSRENGDPLTVGELAGYEIYIVAEVSGQDQVIAVDDPLATSHMVKNLIADTYYFSISSIDTDGLRSAPSELISTVIQ